MTTSTVDSPVNLRQSSDTAPMLSMANVSFRYHPDTEWEVRQIALDLESGDSVALLGPGRCGKSTVLLLSAGILGLSDGSIKINGQELAGLSADRRADIRRTSIGLLSGQSELITELSLLDNVALAAEQAGTRRQEALAKAADLLDQVGLADVSDEKPGSVDVEQIQRCAIAKALVHDPVLVLADEPTGSLDPDQSAAVMALLADLCRAQDAALLVATHDYEVATACQRQVLMCDGRM